MKEVTPRHLGFYTDSCAYLSISQKALSMYEPQDTIDDEINGHNIVQ